MWSESEVGWTENNTEWKRCFKFLAVSVVGDLESVKRWKKAHKEILFSHFASFTVVLLKLYIIYIIYILYYILTEFASSVDI